MVYVEWLTPIVNGIIGDDIVNASEEVKCLVDAKCLEEMMSRPTKDIANKIIKEMNEKYTKWAGITLNQMVNRVYNTRKDLKGDDVFRTIEEDIFRFTNDGESSFLQFHTTWAGDKKQLQRIIGFGHPKLMKKLKGFKHIFFDGTFKTTPKPFKQVWIIMVWDDEDDVYIPVMWILMTGQTAEHYLLALHNIVVAVGGQSPIAPRSATCDFEQAMINAL